MFTGLPIEKHILSYNELIECQHKNILKTKPCYAICVLSEIKNNCIFNQFLSFDTDVTFY